MPNNFRSKHEATDRASNFTRRLAETIGTETDPEVVTPQTGGVEELPYEDVFPLVNQFNQTNMKPGGRRKAGGQTQTGIDRE
jgi:hypothetical protein